MLCTSHAEIARGKRKADAALPDNVYGRRKVSQRIDQHFSRTLNSISTRARVGQVSRCSPDFWKLMGQSLAPSSRLPVATDYVSVYKY